MTRRPQQLSAHSFLVALSLGALALTGGCKPDATGPDPAARRALLTAPIGSAALVFSQGPRGSSETDALPSNFVVGRFSQETPQQVADGFVLSAKTRLQGVSWEGSYFQTGLPTTDSVSFNIRIYTAISITPMFEALVWAGASAVGTSEFGSQIYRFQAILPGPVLEANVPYRIAILDSDTATTVDFRWWKTASQAAGDYAVLNSPGGTWFIQSGDTRHDFVFDLEGASPEPDLVFVQDPVAVELPNALRSNLLVGPGTAQFVQQAADDFSLGLATGIGRISWVGFYGDDQETPLAPTLAFTIRIYETLTAAPQYEVQVTAAVEHIGSPGGTPIYRFSADLSSSLMLQSNRVYWINILESDPNTPTDFMWLQSEVVTQSSDWRQPNNSGGSALATRSSPSNQWFVQTFALRHGFVFSLFRGGAPVPGSTPVGTDVNVEPVDQTTGQAARLELTFANVTSAGATTVTSANLGQGGSPPSPNGFVLGDPPTWYDVETTATFTGAVVLCFDYSGTSYGDENLLELLHYENGAWANVTTSLDTANNIICGSVSSLSPFLVAEQNAAPIVTALTLPAAPIPVGTNVGLSATFTDANPGNTHTATVTWDDGTTTAGNVTSAGMVNASHVYAQPGVYTLSVKVNDGNLEGTRSSIEDAPSYVVVYDPSEGFVTGGGWFDSPTGACKWSGCAADGSTTGKASFGFVSRYQKGANTPTGNTEFLFKAGSLTFRTTSYQWLVVAGSKAQYKGQGEIVGAAGSYGFMITAIDGALTGGAGGPDRFRIKLWDIATGAIIYDNQMGELEDSPAATAIGGGSIVIHR